MSKDAPSRSNAGRPAMGDRIDKLIRFPKAVLDGLERRMKREGLTSGNAAVLEAVADWGDFPDGKPEIERPAPPKPKPPSTASKVKTSTRPALAPGARASKATARGPKITKAPVPVAPRQTVTLGAEPEEAV